MDDEKYQSLKNLTKLKFLNIDLDTDIDNEIREIEIKCVAKIIENNPNLEKIETDLDTFLILRLSKFEFFNKLSNLKIKLRSYQKEDLIVEELKLIVRK